MSDQLDLLNKQKTSKGETKNKLMSAPVQSHNHESIVQWVNEVC